ncbi:MAG: DUF3667 domain-containing protein [Flavobacteriaceae bacterium]|nr:DUF3667 domain-containing protein [Flavobacteriaceae bacterium]
MNKCPNCDIHIEKYCPVCGVKYLGEKSTWKRLITEFFLGFINLDNSVFGTFINILTQPKEVTSSYYNGYRNRYSSPLKLFIFTLFVVGIYILLQREKQLFGISFGFDTVNTGLLILLLLLPVLLLISNLIFYWQKIPLLKQFISLTYASSIALLIALAINVTILVYFSIPDSFGLSILIFTTFFIHSFTITKKGILFKILNFILLSMILPILILIVGLFVR